MKILWGHDRSTGGPIYLPLRALERHVHLVGSTGTGKTTALLTLLTELFPLPFEKQCVIVIDRLGGFSLDLCRWFASGFCPPRVRERLIYIEAAREDVTVPLNPLLHTTPGEGYYRTARAAEIVLRGWESQDLSAMPRLMRWIFNSMYAAATLGLTIADTTHLLFPHSALHRKILASLPEALQYEWGQIIESRGNEAAVQLESTRNRMKPFFDCFALRNMFSSTASRFDVPRWMREKKIVILNLAPMGRVPETAADTIGGMVVNEVFSVARSLPPQDRQETLLVLDEFQRFVRGADLEFALAESRQLKTRLILSHQSLSQLKTDSVDLTSLILQAQTRMMLKVAGLDANILGEELAGYTFDDKKIKDEIYHRQQRVSGHKVIELESRSMQEGWAKNWNDTYGKSWAQHENVVRRTNSVERVRGAAKSRSDQQGRAEGGGASGAQTHGVHQQLVPVYEEIVQLASRTYATFEEQAHTWGRDLRKLKRGEGFLQIVDDEHLYPIAVRRHAPAHLAFEWETVLKQLPRVVEAFHQLLEENARQECFVSPAVVERETRDRLQRILMPVIEVRGEPQASELL